MTTIGGVAAAVAKLDNDVLELRGEIRESKSDISTLREEAKKEFANVRREMKEEFANVRGEMKEEFTNVRREMDERFDEVHEALGDIADSVKTIQQTQTAFTDVMTKALKELGVTRSFEVRLERLEKHVFGSSD